MTNRDEVVEALAIRFLCEGDRSQWDSEPNAEQEMWLITAQDAYDKDLAPVFAAIFHEGRVAENEAFQRDPRGLYYTPVNPYAPKPQSGNNRPEGDRG